MECKRLIMRCNGAARVVSGYGVTVFGSVVRIAALRTNESLRRVVRCRLQRRLAFVENFLSPRESGRSEAGEDFLGPLGMGPRFGGLAISHALKSLTE
ncbi:MAG: hypothetical protein ACKVJU_22300 [Verrucomicrobiales bacterium]